MELFKFMPYREDFFKKRLLRFTPAPLFNDPFEGQVTKSSAVRELHGRMKIWNGKSWDIMTKEMIEASNSYDNAYHSLGILSLTRSKHSLLMWAHYANNHSGIIIGINSCNEFFNQTVASTNKSLENAINLSLLGKLFPVVYERVRPDYPPVTSGNFTLDVLLQKSDEWMYEKEYRMFMKLHDASLTVKNNDEIISLFEIPEDAIIRVILGVRSDKNKILNDFEIAVKDNPKLSHIKFESAEQHKDLYHIEHNLYSKSD